MEKPRVIYEFGPYRLDVANYRLFRRTQEINLGPKAFDFLVVLLRHAGQTLTKAELLATVWKDAIVEENNLSVCVTKLRKVLGQEYVETVAGRGYRFAGEVKIESAPAGFRHTGEAVPPNGALPPGDLRYVTRGTDDEFGAAIQRRDSLVLVKGARQVGKSSLLARALQKARESGCAVTQIDLQGFSSDLFLTLEKLLLALGAEIAHQLHLDPPHRNWDSSLGPSVNLGRYLEREVFTKTETALVCGLDEVDRLLSYPYANDVFGLFRSWHNGRALDPAGPWSQFTLAMALATEPHLFIKDMNQSPFNIGTRLTLHDFDSSQAMELNRAYDSVLPDADLERYFTRLGGHPYLLHWALYAKAHQNLGLEELEAQAERNEGSFGEHLGRMFGLLQQDAALGEAVRTVLQGKPSLDLSDFYRLRSAGILMGDWPEVAKLRCELYASYLGKRLLRPS